MTRSLRVELPPLHAAQASVHDCPARFRVLAAGRRFGKSLLGGLEASAVALAGGRAWWVAPSYKMSRPGWRVMEWFAAQLQRRKLDVRVNRAERVIYYPSGGEAACRSADDPQSLRGEGLDLVVLDECRQIREIAWTEALRPALSDRGGRALFISTPAGHDWFWRLWQRGNDAAVSDYEAFRYPTSANPFIPASEIEDARRELPDRVFRQEYLAEFVTGEGQVFRNVYACATATPQERALPGHTYVVGVDWGRVNDFTVICVIDETTSSLVALDRFTRVGYEAQMGRLVALCDRFQPRLVVPEMNSMGGPLVEDLQRRGLPVRPFVTSNATKTAAIDGLALAFETEAIRIIPDEVLLTELQAFEESRTPLGLRKHSAPEGMHDDCVMSLAFAWSQAVVGGGHIRPEDLVTPNDVEAEMEHGPWAEAMVEPW